MTVGQDGCGHLAHLLSPHLLSPGHPGYGEILVKFPYHKGNDIMFDYFYMQCIIRLLCL